MDDGTDEPSLIFIDAVRLTTERETATGRPWCPAPEARGAEYALRRRGNALGGPIRQAVRLLRAMEAAGSAGYVGFLWCDTASIETRNFVRLFEKAAASGRLAGIAEIVRSKTGEAERLRMLEGAMDSKSGAVFDVGFGQMPLLGALVDMMHNMLGYPEFAALAKGVLGGRDPSSAEETAVLIEKAVCDWLSPHLASLHRQRVAGAMRGLLEDRGPLSADLVDDAAILDAWIRLGAVPEKDAVDGFREFASAARHMLAYGAGLRTAEAVRAAGRAKSIASGAAEEGGVDPDALVPAEADGDLWVSPMIGLFSDPAARAKWLTDKGRRFVARIFEDPRYAGDDEEDGTEDVAADPDGDEDGKAPDDDGRTGRSLFSGARPSGRFALTILRAHHFAPEQKRRSHGRLFNPSAEDGYASAAGRYAALRADAVETAAAGARRLLPSGDPGGLLLAAAFAPDEIGPVLEASVPETESNVVGLTGVFDSASVARRLSADIAPRTSAVGVRLRAAAEKVSRAGFRKKDADDPAMTEALTAGAPHFADWVHEVSRIDGAVAAALADDLFRRDEALFSECFDRMYAAEAAAPEGSEAAA